MARRLLAGVVIAAALGAAGTAAAGQMPLLRSATTVQRHLVLELWARDLRPIELTVSRRREVAADGAFPAQDVRLRERIQLPPTAAGLVRWQSAKTLRPGIWFVQVAAIETGGVTDCPKAVPNCVEHWSNVRRVAVRS